MFSIKPLSFKRHRFPAAAVRQAVWLYLRFSLSLRDIEELMAAREIDVSYETIRCTRPRRISKARALVSLMSFFSISP